MKEEKKDEFISIASHEMKTPLTTAKAYLQLTEQAIGTTNEPAYLYAKKASSSIDRLHGLISELLDVSKIQHGKLAYNISRFNFNEMLDSTIEGIQYASPKHTIIKKGKVKQEVTGDRNRLQQVLINLLSNAVKYSPDANEVLVYVEEQDDNIKVAVKDKGIGLSPNSLEKIFERYYRVEEHAVQFQGLGIGLFISYEIIRRHKGTLWVESEQGKGSTFYFTLPIVTEG
jgi:signal transduction histidine kinase